MLQIDFPDYNFKFRSNKNTQFIFDEVRKKWLVLLPEEWVRQNFIQYLIQVKKYPAPLIAIEKGIQLGELKKRCDIVVFKNSRPWMIVECKSSTVELSEKVVDQIFRYNLSLRVEYLVITNGQQNFAIRITDQTVTQISHLPDWNDS